MTQATLFSSNGEYPGGLPGGVELGQKAAQFALEVASTVTLGVARQVGGMLLGRELTDMPQRTFTIQDGQAHSMAVAAIRRIRR